MRKFNIKKSHRIRSGLCVWNRCNNRCIMCSNPIGFEKKEASWPYQIDKIILRMENLEKFFKKNLETITFTGGEPTIHPHFLNLLNWTRNRFPENKIFLLTNGRMFSYPRFAKECLKIDKLEIEISLHGGNAQIHDKITQVKGSFKQTLLGIENIQKYLRPSQVLGIRTVLIKQNYKHLDELFQLVKKKFQTLKLIIIFPEFEGRAEIALKKIGISYQEVKKYLIEGFQKWQYQLKEIRLYHFPLCTLPPGLWKFTWRTLNPDEVAFLPRCKKCLYKKYCLGIHKNYLKLIGENEFSPIKEKFLIKKGETFFHPISEAREN